METNTNTHAAGTPAAPTNSERLAAAAERLHATLNGYVSVQPGDLGAFTRAQRSTWDQHVQFTRDALANVTAWVAAGDARDWETSEAERLAGAHEDRALVQGAILAQAIEDSRHMLPIGDPTSIEDEDAYRRGQQYMRMGRLYGYDSDSARQTGATAWDILTYARRNRAIADEEIRSTCRTLRAAQRAHGYSSYDRVMADLVNAGALTSPVWRTTVDPAQHMRLVDESTSANRALVPTLPTSPREMPAGCTIADIVAAAWEHEREHERQFAALAEALRDEAEEQGWCGEYERTVERLNAAVSLAGEPFLVRHREWDVRGSVQVTVTVSVPISTVVTANDEGDALDEASGSDWDVDEYAIADALGVSVGAVRGVDWDVDRYSVEWDEANPA